MNKPLFFITGLALATFAFSRDFRPEAYLETIPAADSSVQECYVFRTTAGVRYTVESTNNLIDWTAQEEIYGLGNEYVVTMRQFTPPPPPPPGGPPILFSPPAKNVSIQMQRCATAEGGTLISWPSLDQSGPISVWIAGEMAPEWFQIPLYCERFDRFYFFIWNPSSTAAPPVISPTLGVNDSAMLAVLEASLPTMNEQVITSVARARNAPAPIPIPTDPNSLRFWRVWVNPNIDTDMDGTLDWAEFEIAARDAATPPPSFSRNAIQAANASGGGGGGSSASGNAFNADTNGDGIPDGEQLDTDRDGVFDAFDIAAEDNTAAFSLGLLPRYALFEIPRNALQISDLGTILYSDKTWKGGVTTNLPSGPAGSSLASGRGINDADVILGTEGRDVSNPANPQYLNGKICFWSSPTQPYQSVQVTEGGETVYAYREHDGFGNQGPGSILSSSGQFVAHGHVFDPEPDYVDAFNWAPTLWQIPSGSSGTNRQALVASTRPPLPFVPFNIISQMLPKGGSAIFATPPVDFTHSTNGETSKVYLEDKWHESPTFSQSIDISADGTAIGQSHGGLTAPVLLNGKWTSITRYAPGAPSEWADINTALIDTTPGGWVLASRGIESPPVQAVMLPLRMEGEFTDQYGTLVKKAAGVDDISIGSSDPGPAVSDRIWIMAPKDGPAKAVTLKAPLNPGTPLTLSATGVDFGGVAGSVTLTAPETLLSLTAGSATTGTDILLDLKFGTLASLSKPLGVKVMKNRIVDVTVHLVTSRIKDADPSKPDKLDPSNFQPTKLQLEKYLNDVYGPQVNARFEVKRNAPVELEWDKTTSADLGATDLAYQGVVVPGNKRLDFLGGAVSPEENTINGALHDNNADINVYILGGGALTGYVILPPKMLIAAFAYGLARRNQNMVFVDGDSHLWGLGRDNDAELMHTIAHEIGHCIIADGHPDEGGGAAQLSGLSLYSHKQRLMVSGSNVNHSKHGNLLVKGEWDAAEEWLKTRPNGDN